MKFKLEENLGSRSARLLSEAHHDVETVPRVRRPQKRTAVIEMKRRSSHAWRWTTPRPSVTRASSSPRAFTESLSGVPDERVFEACVNERRYLITLDLDFADVLRFPPHKASGIAVLRLPKGASLRLLERFVSEFVHAIRADTIHGRLRIIEPGRIRVHEDTTGAAESSE
jgi:hypothetical protein